MLEMDIESGVDAQTEELARVVIGAAIEVHRLLGPGFPESVYQHALSHELTLRGIEHQNQVHVPVLYKGLSVGEGKIDVLVGKRLIVELKSAEQLIDTYRAQCVAYLCATKLQLALLINFNVPVLKNGIKRIVKTT